MHVKSEPFLTSVVTLLAELTFSSVIWFSLFRDSHSTWPCDAFQDRCTGFKRFTWVTFYVIIILIWSRRQSCHAFVITRQLRGDPRRRIVFFFYSEKERQKEREVIISAAFHQAVHFKSINLFDTKIKTLRLTVQNLLKKHQQDGLFINAFLFSGTTRVVLKGSRLVFKILQILDGLSEEPMHKSALQDTDSAFHVVRVWLN